MCYSNVVPAHKQDPDGMQKCHPRLSSATPSVHFSETTPGGVRFVTLDPS
jgi:hypothetical protein